jgi:cytochrome c oxidase subunit I+III
MRLQLARPNNTLMGPDLYNQVFTMHGTTMMFLFAVPVMQAVAIYLVPLMIGARSVAFPRMNAYAYWIFLFGGLMLYIAFFLNIGPDAGWFAYVPLAGPDYSPGKRIDFWAQMITFTELSALLEAVVLITTVFKLRAPGMTLNRMPLFVWAMLVTAFMVLFAMPAVMLASTALITDRLVGTHFYNPARAATCAAVAAPVLVLRPPRGLPDLHARPGLHVGDHPTFARRPIFGYTAMVLSLIATAFLAFGLWVHHMFATNLPELGKSFFTAASMLIAIPTAVQIFCWIATLWTGRSNFKTPLLFVLSFFFILVLGGLTGPDAGLGLARHQVHDTYFVVAHLHYVLLGGAVFPLFGAFYYWFPKFTGRMMSERLGRWNFWLMFIGFNVAFFPMHCWACRACRAASTPTRRMGWGNLNLLSTVGALTLALSILLFIVNVVRSRRAASRPAPTRGAPARWNGRPLAAAPANFPRCRWCTAAIRCGRRRAGARRT